MSDRNQCGCCRSALAAGSARPVSAGLCDACRDTLAQATSREACRTILQGLEAPVLLLQSDPRQVFTANDRALTLFGRRQDEAEAHRGGEVFGCLHSFSELGCGKDPNCEDCRIKGTIVATFGGVADTGSAVLTIRRADDRPYRLTVSTEQVGPWALVRIDHFVEEQMP